MKNKIRLLFFSYTLCSFFGIFLLIVENSFALPSHSIPEPLFKTNGVQENVLIKLNQPVDISYFSLKSPDRIVVDIKDSFLPEGGTTMRVKSRKIQTIRTGQNQKDSVRVVLDLKPGSTYKFSADQYIGHDSHVLSLLVSSIEPKTAVIKGTGTIFSAKSSTKAQDPFNPEPGPSSSASSLALAGETDPADPKDKKAEASAFLLTDDSLPEGLFEETQEEQPEQKDWKISGLVHARAANQIKNNEKTENKTSFRNRIMVEAEYKNWLVASVLSDYMYFSEDDRVDDYDINLHELKWQYDSKRIGITLGKQIIRWGKTDQISPVDTLNPEDLRESIIPEYEERKIPIWMADIRYYFSKFTLEGVLIPFFEESRQDYFQTNWSAFGHMKKDLNDSALPSRYKSYFNNLSVHEQEPDNEIEWGLRLTTTIQSVDLGFTFHHTTEDSPYYKSFPVKNIDISGGLSADNLMSGRSSAVLTDEDIEVEYLQTNIAGIEFETVLGGFGIRAEAAWHENESFITSSLTSVRKPTFIYILGADYTTTWNTYLNLQVAHRHVSNYDPSILYIKGDETSLLGEIQVDTISDRFQACLKFTKPIDNGSYYLNPYLKITYITNLECRIGASLFSGDPDTWLGRFKDDDVYYLDLSYRF